MLAPEVLVEELLLDRFEVGLELKRHQRHLRDALDGDRILQRLRHAGPPGKRRVPVDENAGKVGWIAVPHCFHDDVAGLPFIIRGDLAWPHLAGDGHLAVEIVGMGRAEYRNGAAGLRERGRAR